MRGDLNPADGIYPIGGWGQRNHVGYDAKITSYLVILIIYLKLYKDNMKVQIISGPTYDQVPPFVWSKSPFSQLTHLGMVNTKIKLSRMNSNFHG